MTLRKLSKIASVGMAVIGLVLVPPLRAFQTEDTTKAVTKRAKKSANDATSNAASSDTNTANTTDKPFEKTERANSSTDAMKKARSTSPNTVSVSEISAAKASGKVWVNTESGVYHKSSQLYGATKQGKFMTEQEAQQAGYRAAKSK